MTPDEVRHVIGQAARLRRDGRFDDAVALLGPAAKVAREQLSPALAIEATFQESLSLGMAGDRDGAFERASWALATATRPANRELLSAPEDAFTVTMAFYSWAAASRRHHVAFDHILLVLDEAEAFLRGVGRLDWLGGLAAERASVLDRLGRHQESVPLWREALEHKRARPDAPGMTLDGVRRHLAGALGEVGELDEEAALLRELLASPDLDRLDQVGALSFLGQNALERGAVTEAVECAGRAIDLGEAMGDMPRAAAYGLAVMAHLAAGDLPRARAAADRELEAAERMAAQDSVCQALLDQVDVALREGDRGRAQASLDRAEPLASFLDRQRGVSTFGDMARERAARLADFEGVSPETPPE